MNKENLIYGINALQHMLENSPHKLLEIYVATNRQDSRAQKLVDQAQQQNISIQKIDIKKLDQWLLDCNHQGVAAKITATTLLQESDLCKLCQNNPKALFLILDGVQDPHNFGACLRTADAAGVTAVIIPRDNSVSVTSVVRKVASGAADSVNIVQVGNLARAMRELQQHGVWIAGTAADGEQSLYAIDFTGPTAIVLGAEGSGIRQLTRQHCDYLVHIPMLGSVESLNVSVATAVCLYEIVRQRIT